MRDTFFYWVMLIGFIASCQSKKVDPRTVVRHFIEAQNKNQVQRIDSLLHDQLTFPPYQDRQEFIAGLAVSQSLHTYLDILNMYEVEAGIVRTTEKLENDLTRIYGFGERLKEMTYTISKGQILSIKAKDKNQEFIKKEKAFWKWLYEQSPEEAQQLREQIAQQADFRESLAEWLQKYRAAES